MDNSSKLTIALLTYNRAKYLRPAIEAILKQSYKEFVFFILDNASTDNTEEIVKSFQDDRIKYVRHEINIGAYGNGLKALELTKTPYLITTHDDDIMKPDMIMREVNILDNNPDVVAVFSNVSIIDDDGEIIEEAAHDIQEDIIYKKDEYIADFCKGKNILACPTAMLRMSFFNKYDLKAREDAGLACDAFFWFEVNNYDKALMYVIKEPLLFYRIHNEQGSGSDSIKMHYDVCLYAVKNLHSYGLEHMIAPFKSRIKTIVIIYLLDRFYENKISDMEIKKKIMPFEEAGIWNVKADVTIRQAVSFFMVTHHCAWLVGLHHKIKESLKARTQKFRSGLKR